MKKRSIRVYTVVSSSFRYGFLVMATSLLRHNKDRQISFVVVHHPQLSPLSAAHQVWLQKYVPGIDFRVPDLEPYAKIFHLRDAVFRTPRRLWAAFFILEAFADDSDSEVLSLDSDLVCLGPLEEDFFDGEGFGAVEAADELGRSEGFFNTGVMRIGRSARGHEIFSHLMSEADARKYRPRSGRADQALPSLFYTPKTSGVLARRYNVTRRQVPSVGLREFLSQNRTVFFHYVGAKPWQVSLDQRDVEGVEAEEIWDCAVRDALTPADYIAYLEDWREASRSSARVYLREVMSLPLYKYLLRRNRFQSERVGLFWHRLRGTPLCRWLLG